MQVTQPLKDSLHHRLYSVQAHVLRLCCYSQVAYSIRQVISNNKQVLFLYHFLKVLFVALLDVLKVPVFKFDNILAKVFLLNLIKRSKLPLLVSSIVK